MNILEQIVSDKRIEVERLVVDLPVQSLPERAVPVNSLADALSAEGTQIIAELKRQSPSAGALGEVPDPKALARAYEAGGAAAISVLTDMPYFGGNLNDLQMVRPGLKIPILRKDFIINAYQVHESWSAGADAILLIADILTDSELADLYQLTYSLGMEALVECYSTESIARVTALEPQIAGLNARDLSTMTLSLGKLLDRKAELPAGSIHVAESGITSAEDFAAVSKAGYDAVLIGTALVTARNPEAAVAEMLGARAVDAR